jgi:hypothetical protein
MFDATPTTPGVRPSVAWLAGASRRDFLADVRERRVEASFAATWAYAITFLLTRGTTTYLFLTRGDVHAALDGIHIHHMVPGLMVLLAGGLLSLDVWERFGLARLVQGILLGVGAALVLDEFCLILFVEDTYWATQGVLVSAAALVLFGLALVANAYLGRHFYRALGHHTRVAVANAVAPRG